MGYPIKKAVMLVWSGTEWRDEVTGVSVIGVLPPHPVVQKVAEYPEDVQPEGWHHPFDKSYVVTYEQVQKMIADAFECRVIPQVPPYMMDDEWLVNYKWLRREGDYRQSRIDDLQRQVEQLKARRWWKRW